MIHWLAGVLLALGASAAMPAVTAPATAPTARVPGTNLLLLRLALRMDRIDQDYAVLSAAERSQQVTAAEGLLRQLRGRYLTPPQQNSVFKVEMRVRVLRGELEKKR